MICSCDSSTGRPVCSKTIVSQLKWILSQPSDPSSYPISYLSATNRD